MKRLAFILADPFLDPDPPLASDLTLPPIVLRDRGDTDELEPRKLLLPYAFATETLGVAGGVGAGASAWPSEQASLFGIVMGTSNSSWATYLIGTSMKIPGGRRWFLDTSISVGWFTQQRLYVDGNPNFPEGGAGGNDSDPENYVEGEGWHNWALFNFKYVLPVGESREASRSRRSSSIGGSLLARLLGRVGGIHDAVVGPFCSWSHSSSTARSNRRPASRRAPLGGLSLSMLYDNRDFSPNPSRGSATSLGIASGVGLDDDSQSWTSMRGKYSKYLSLGESRRIRQQVLALNVWTAYTPTWGNDDR